MPKSIQLQLYEKTNLLKVIEPQIKECVIKKKKFFLSTAPILLVGALGTLVSGSFLPASFAGFLSVGFFATSGYFQFKENKLKSQFEETFNEIEGLREVEMAKNLHSDSHVIRQFKYI